MTASLALAADIGGTTMRAALVDRSGSVLARTARPTQPERGLDDAAERLVSMLADVRGAVPSEVAALGISTAGPIDPATGTYRQSPNLSTWDGRTMKPALEAALGVPVAVGHDATLAAMAEVEFGAGRGMRDLVYLTVSTGVGAGIIANGLPVTGATGGAGEAGHLIIRRGGPTCAAGCEGCLEALVSGTGIAAAALRRAVLGHQTRLRDLDTMTAVDVFDVARDGDEVAQEIVADVVQSLAAGLAGLLAVFDPQLVVLGGGVIDGLRAYWGDVVAATQAQALPRYSDGVPLAISEFGDSVSLLGASVLAFQLDDGARHRS